MRIHLLPILILLMLPAVGASLSADQMAHLAIVPGDQRPADRDAIRAHIDSIFQAYIAKDRETVRATHAEHWRGFLTRSPSILRGIDEYMTAADRSLRGPGGIFSYQMKEFDVLFYGEVALVPYVADMVVGVGDLRITRTLRVLDVYTRIGGEWIQIASNTSIHPDSAAEYRQQPYEMLPGERDRLLNARESLWRAWFDHDRAHLQSVLPEETLTISAIADQWAGREDQLVASKEFHDSGARLTRLEFPRTEIQRFGDVAILYTTYEFEIETADGEHLVRSGRGTEVFVERAGSWVHPGWHLDGGPVSDR
ncbi:MAG: nuclear transport factor 2 family protein [Thermoanaerobaculia bacterium]|nr:nuclear transport factor 2 family protein [Thermoanaerobaculia bacterium]